MSVNGCYLYFKLTPAGAKNALNVARRVYGMKNLVPEEKMHVTLFVDKEKPMTQEFADTLGELRVTTFVPKSCKRLGEQSVVLEFEPQMDLLIMREKIEAAGYKDPFPSYSMHTTLSYDFPEDAALPENTDAWPPICLCPTPILEPYVDEWKP